MARRHRGDPIHGWLVIDKGRGISSASVVNRARRSLNAAKAGHGGTLDPLATGLLPIAFGEATKTVSYVMDGKKSYTFTVRWGEQRDTDDSEGSVIETHDHRPSAAEIEAVLGEFIGDISQVPPSYSAIKVDGQRAYALARADKPVELAARIIHIAGLALTEIPDQDRAMFSVQSGKGAYMRSLGRDIARRLGTVGHIETLRRTAVGPFVEDDAISLEQFEELGHSPAAVELLRPVETALDDIPALALTENEARRLKCGQAVSALQVARRTPLKNIDQGAIVCAMAEGKPVALARFESGEIRPIRVLNL
jgi:tRNA pseudouridine55 synthase